ncbi:MAG: CARDB domain-containing protein [Haloplanus sp.]
MSTDEARAVLLSLLAILSVVGGTVAFGGAATAATSASISPDDSSAGATDVTYTAEANVELSNQDTLQYVDVDLGDANVSAVGSGDVRLFVDGTEYTDGFSQFSASGGTVEFKLANSRSVSDGDPVRVVVADVTNPSDDFGASVTLHDTGDSQWQSFSDTVAIDTASSITYSNLVVNRTTVSPGDDVEVTATVENTGGSSGTYNASLRVDGIVQRYSNGTLDSGSSTTVSFVIDFGSTGTYDVGIETLGSTSVGVVGPTDILGGSADPARVRPGETVNNQEVMIEVANVSQDGDTDTHYVEFPNALASGLSVNSVDSSATSITSSPNLVDGFDDDGVTETVEFATSGDAGSTVDTTLTVDASVTYPDTQESYPVDARTVDSTGDTVTKFRVVGIEALSEDDDGGDDTVPSPGSVELSVTSFRLVAGSEDVDVVVSTTRSVDTLRVSVSGAADAELVRSDFTVRERDGNVTYVADVETGTTGTVSATVETVAAEGSPISPDVSDALTVGPSGTGGASAVATPPWTEESDSAHTFVATISENSAVANETLRNVDIGYSRAFLNGSGSVSSVSDDQNVVMLKVVAEDGSVKSKMGGTDAVTVNVDDGTVELDLADVDSSRKPTLAPGDRVLVRIRPVTNAEVGDTYETTLTLETTGGNSAQTDLNLEIRTEASTDAFASAVVQPSDERVSVDLIRSSDVGSVTVASDADAAGTVRVTIPRDRPDVASDLAGSVVTTMTIARPDPVEDESATISTSIARDAFEGSADALVLARYDTESGEWVKLDTTVTSSDANTVTLQATTSETSLFAVTDSDGKQMQDGQDGKQMQDDSQQTAEPTDTAQPTSTDAEETSSSGAGFGVVLSALAVLGAALLLARRN